MTGVQTCALPILAVFQGSAHGDRARLRSIAYDDEMGRRVLMVAVSILGCVAACGEKAPDCASVIARWGIASTPGALHDEVRSNLRAVLSNRCAEDRWSAEAIACTNTVTNADELRTCGDKHLSQEQGDKVRRATSSILSGVPAEAPEAKPATSASAAMVKMVGFADLMCQCTTRSCADDVQDQMTRWSTEMAAQAASTQHEKPDASMLEPCTRSTFQGESAWEYCRVTKKYTFDDGARSEYDLYFERDQVWWNVHFLVADTMKELPESIRQYLDSIRLTKPE